MQGLWPSRAECLGGSLGDELCITIDDTAMLDEAFQRCKRAAVNGAGYPRG
jgi:hypothetical protein